MIATVRRNECSKEMGNIPVKQREELTLDPAVHSHISFGYD